MEPIKEDDGITIGELDAILAADQKAQAKITTGMPGRTRRKKRKPRKKKKSPLETGVRQAIEEGIIETKL